MIPFSEVRFIGFLLTETTLSIKHTNNNSSKFDTWIGSPQGDALSPVLFTIYLEACMKSIRKTYPEECYELTYADDIDFITTTKDLDLDNVGKLLQDWSLKLNQAKTEILKITYNNSNWKKSKKLGSLLGTEEEIDVRKRLATLAMNKLNSIWKSNINLSAKIRIYKSYIVSIFLHGCSAWADSKTIRNKINAFQRKMIRRINKEYWPNIMKNDKCDQILPHLHLEVKRRRLQMQGHICPNDLPANRILKRAMEQNVWKKGRPPATLLNTLTNDLKSMNLTFEQIAEMDKSEYRTVIEGNSE